MGDLSSMFLWLAITLLAYLAALYLHKKAGASPLLHPLIVTSLLVALVLYLSGFEVAEYQQHTHLLHLLLGPATVALAVPLYRQVYQIRDNHSRLLLPILVGGTVAPVTCVIIMIGLGSDLSIILSSWTKSITTPLAMETTGVIGGEPALAAVLVIVTGVIGAIAANGIFKLTGIKDDISKGVALGTAAHAVGTAQSFQISEKTGAFSSLALCINGILTAIVLPIVIRFIS